MGLDYSVFNQSTYAQLGNSYEATETITITRYARGGTDRNDRTATTIFAGPADVQIGNGDTYTDAGGLVQQTEAIAVIDAQAGGAFPDIRSGDVVSVARANGIADVYTVIQVNPYNFPPANLELSLRKGTGKYDGPAS